MEFKTRIFLQVLLVLLCVAGTQQSTPVLSSFQELGSHHCDTFPIEILWRISTGHLSEKYGESYFDFDCYIRQFVKKDGMTIFDRLPESDDEEQQQSEEDEGTQEEQNIPHVDPLVEEYAKGVKKCLPDGVEPVEGVYSMWRFIRYIVQHDYAFEWMRAKIRSGMGYEAERPNAWMDGQTKAERLRLDKLFSNQFYEYVDQLMFKDFLYPIMTFLKQNTVFAVSGDITESGKPILVQSLLVHNYHSQIFKPIILKDKSGDIFTYTIPGVPLLFAGSNSKIAWAFTGVLVDRSNIEQIETVGNKFYSFETEQWIPLTTENLTIQGVPDKTCQFTYSASGTLYTKQNRTGKVSEYISKWHQNEKKVRVLFSGVYDLIKSNGVLQEKQDIQFPFNSIVLVNDTGIFQYLCPQFYPSYFLYPDMFGQPEKIENRWISYKKKYVAVSNTQLTTSKQESYRKGEMMSPVEQQIAINIRKINVKVNKFTVHSAMQFIQNIKTTPYIKKQRDMLTSTYRKVKFIYFPEDNIRKEGDKIISAFEKWDNTYDHKNLAPIYMLWEYFYRDFTFNYISVSEYGKHIARHKIASELYWANQMALWFKGTSYGQCDSHEYEERQHEYNGTHNSTCYFNMMRGFNRTRQIITEKYGDDLSKISLDDFTQKKVLDITEGVFKGTEVEEVFLVHYSRQLFFGAQIGSSTIRYNPAGYLEDIMEEISIGDNRSQQNPIEGDL